MPQGQKNRTITYLRAVWHEESDYAGSLQDAVQSCLEVVGPNSIVPLRAGQAQLRHSVTREGPSRLLLHMASWTDREPVSTVPHALDSGDLGEQAPGRDYDYLDGDGMFLVCGDHCLLMPSGLQPRTMEQYLKNLLAEGGEPFSKARLFRLVAVADQDVVKRVSQEGVKSIGLELTSYRASDISEETRISTSLGRSVLRALLKRPEDLRRLDEAHNVKAMLYVTLHGGIKGMTPEEFSPLAQEITGDYPEDDVELVTSKGNRIRRGELLLKKYVKVDGTAKTVHYNHAWEQLEAYLTELAESRMIVV